MSVIPEGGLALLQRMGFSQPGSRPEAAARAGIKLAVLGALTFAACFAIRAVLVKEAASRQLHTLVEAGAGGLSDAQLTALMADAGPGAVHIAAEHDADAPLAGLGRPIGWKRLEVTAPPRLWLGKLSMQEAQAVNGAIADAQAANPPADPFVLRAAGPERAAALQCMTAAIYYEAALEPREGQEAVAQVVLNRMRHPGYPKSVCGVVFQGSDRPGCQFSFACDGSMARAPVSWAWRNAHDVAEQALDGFVMKRVGTATHYHTTWVVAAWTPTLLKVAQIGAHLFFRPLGSQRTGSRPAIGSAAGRGQGLEAVRSRHGLGARRRRRGRRGDGDRLRGVGQGLRRAGAAHGRLGGGRPHGDHGVHGRGPRLWPPGIGQDAMDTAEIDR